MSVEVEQYRSQSVYVMGEVRQPAEYPLTGDLTIVDLLAKAVLLAQRLQLGLVARRLGRLPVQEPRYDRPVGPPNRVVGRRGPPYELELLLVDSPYRAPEGPVRLPTEALRAELLAHKPELLAVLRIGKRAS